MILAVDTATRWTGIALHDGRSLTAERGWRSINNQTVDLAPAVADVMSKAGLTSSDLSAVAVAIGPGSYTGLRIGLGFAKGLVLANRAKLIGISTLDIVAAGTGEDRGELIVVAEAGRTRICAGSYQWRGSKGWQSSEEPDIYGWDDLLDITDGPATFVGEITPAAAKLVKACDKEFKVVTAVKGVRRAGFLAELAWLKLRRGWVDDPDELVPVYLRDPSGAIPASDKISV
ncbi:MAG TPA: tRNA (adenosine(37)-N6)-threonylcarbamoyltransferase complex dimerization subunit type 1 TsaB [candidate division Zixibacteria bacterium]|nr:tRNA (adenosine(37)-N6)-threonylcarbamoyltransferase complex dimerization subunit type 1 TsaB [candidate division Zixibacteria bacterium]